MTLEPYTKSKPMRNAIEQAAEAFCQKKQPNANSKQPDFIFTTDGCTRFPDDSWGACCVVHDISYWCGGSEADRQAADQEFRRCIDNKVHMMGDIMYAGVRIGGSPWWPTPWRWGYGWENWPEGYRQHFSSEPSLKQLLDELKLYETVERQLLK